MVRSSVGIFILNSIIAALLFIAGCLPGTSNNEFMTPQRLEYGLIIVLPGIEGESPLNHDIRSGLLIAGVPGAIPIYRWGRPVPVAGPLINQMDFIGNRLEGKRIAQMIMDYQDNHPGKKVFLVGHSGGGGVAVFAAESLPEDRQVNGLILLSASISYQYDLTKALAHCKDGIVNFYTKADIGLLGVGTTLAGNVDGAHGAAAGAVGFERPEAAGQSYSKVYQVQLADYEVTGWSHAATTQTGFVASQVAPWILGDTWPATGADSLAQYRP